MKKCGMGLLLCGVLLASCKQDETSYPATDPRLETRLYCNIPEAVNYNWNFPGKPDSSVCIYPADLFSGRYRYTDSVYFPDGSLDSARSQTEQQIQITATGRNAVRINGLCPNNAFILTAPRTGFIATFDTTIRRGQPFCRPQDTITGILRRDFADTMRLSIQYTVVSDTATNLHTGTAYRR